MDKPGEVANPAHGQLDRENALFSVPVHAGEFGPVREVRPSRPASTHSFSPQAESGAYSRDSSHFPRRLSLIPSTTLGSVPISISIVARKVLVGQYYSINNVVICFRAISALTHIEAHASICSENHLCSVPCRPLEHLHQPLRSFCCKIVLLR